jgi:hypothetical protein
VAFQNMRAELRGSLPKFPFAFTGTVINRAWRDIREANLWSFNLFESTWISPGTCAGGGVTTVQGSPTLQFDATAIAAINAFQAANPYMLVTQLQFRIASGGIYSVIQYNPTTGVATLDRAYGDPSQTDGTYLMYQSYYAAPMKDFLGWISVRNPSLFVTLDTTTTREWIDNNDPQRMIFQFPTRVISLGIDLRGQGTANASATLGFPLFELWGQAVTPFTYQCYGLRKGVDLVNPTDTLPLQVPEELVMARAKYYAYEWCEANKDIVPRATGPDFRFLMSATMDDYKKLLTKYRRQDKEYVNNYFTLSRLPYGVVAGTYNTLAGVATTNAPN